MPRREWRQSGRMASPPETGGGRLIWPAALGVETLDAAALEPSQCTQGHPEQKSTPGVTLDMDGRKLGTRRGLKCLEYPKKKNVLHVRKVKPWNETTRFGDRGAQPSYEMIDGEPEYEVETLLARKVVNGRVSYLVKWVGYDHCENMWIRRSYLDNARDLVREYDDAHPF